MILDLNPHDAGVGTRQENQVDVAIGSGGFVLDPLAKHELDVILAGSHVKVTSQPVDVIVVEHLDCLRAMRLIGRNPREARTRSVAAAT